MSFFLSTILVMFARFCQMRTEMPSTEVAVSLAVHDERIADSPADMDVCFCGFS